MTKTLSALMLVAIAAVGISACTQESSVSNLPPGKYESTSSRTNAYGTTVEKKSSTDVSVDDYGHKRAVIESETTRDPKGFFNKTTTSKTKVIEEQ
jgi:hypothetical protein